MIDWVRQASNRTTEDRDLWRKQCVGKPIVSGMTKHAFEIVANLANNFQPNGKPWHAMAPIQRSINVFLMH